MDNISFERVWEDSDFFQIKVTAQSKLICANTRSYTTEELINELALHLETFPKTTNDRYLWENGAKGDGSTPCVILEFFCKNRSGHVGIEVYMEIDDGGARSKHNCCFFMEAEPGLLNKFGKSLRLLNNRGIGQKASLLERDN